MGDEGQHCKQKSTKSDVNGQTRKPRNRQNHYRLHWGTMNVRTKYYSKPAADTVEPEFKFTKVLMSKKLVKVRDHEQNAKIGE